MSQNDYFCISLGHNSSVVHVDKTGKVISGYEEERFTRVKSEPNFPINAFYAAKPSLNSKLKTFLLSHWYNDFDFWKNKDDIYKRYDYDFVKNVCNDIIALNRDFTHHDAHASAGIAFYESHSGPVKDQSFVIVADGFGNLEEVLSIYQVYDSEPTLIERIHGYHNSMGLFYQYATSYCGMKENEDEYKFLGYESEIRKLMNADSIIPLIDRYAKNIAEQFIMSHENEGFNQTTVLRYIDLEKLTKTRKQYCEIFDNYLDYLKTLSVVWSEGSIPNLDHLKRILIGYFIQSVLEHVILHYVKKYNMTDVVLAGGIFYNVKLNSRINHEIPGECCVYPLAGDQGAALGLFEKYIDNENFILDDLKWGTRPYYNTFLYDAIKPQSHDELVDNIVTRLINNEIVNVVTGRMEFGPRALCNTSTLALPFPANVDYINKLNGRSSIMPMAPVMLQKNMPAFFPYWQWKNKVIGSDEYMVITYNYHNDVEYINYGGIMHRHPIEDVYTGRPQIIKTDSYMKDVLDRVESITGFKALINTSFNVHGRPIVYSHHDAFQDYLYQKKRQGKQNVSLIIYDKW